MKNKKQTKYIIVVENRWGFKSHIIITKEKLLDNLIFCKEKIPEIW